MIPKGFFIRASKQFSHCFSLSIFPSFSFFLHFLVLFLRFILCLEFLSAIHSILFTAFFFCFYSQFCFICRVHHKTVFITFFVISMSTDYYFPLMSVQSQLIQTREIDVLAGFWRYMILKSHLFDTYCNELWFSKNIYRNHGYVQASTRKKPINKDLFLVKDNWDINVIISQNFIVPSEWNEKNCNWITGISQRYEILVIKITRTHI